MASSWACVGLNRAQDGLGPSQDRSRQIRDKPKTAPKTPPRRPRSILYCFLQGFLSVDKNMFKNHCKKQYMIAPGDPDLFFAMIFEHFFCDVKNPCKQQYRIHLGHLGGVFGVVLGLSRICQERSWLCLGLVLFVFVLCIFFIPTAVFSFHS